MSDTASVKTQYETIMGYRAGACYCKADLHTHSPASECSSFALPNVLEKLLRETKPKSGEATACDKAFDLLQRVVKGQSQIIVAFDRSEFPNLDGLCPKPKPLRTELKRIAKTWIDAIGRVRDDDSAGWEGEAYDLLKLAHRDVENYLASCFFPQEFVLRCYIEKLQVVALTDHNHPGYIVPRLQQLGTWYDKMQEVNRCFCADLDNNDGAAIRKAVLARLEAAKQRLHTSLAVHTSDEIKENHKEISAKELADRMARKAHVEERIVYWTDKTNPVGRLVLLPGVEITVSAVHMLAVFPPTWYVPGRIGAILRSIGIPEAHWGQGFIAAATSSVQDTMALVAANGGIAIPAHSNSDFKGLLRLFKKGLELQKILEHPALVALETVGGTVIAGKGKKRGKKAWQTLKWLVDGERRDEVRPLCFVKGSDAHECRMECDGTGEDLGARYTNIKIDLRPSDTADEIFAALRMALLSGQSRVIEAPVEDGYDYHSDRSLKAEKRKDLLYLPVDRPIITGLVVSGAKSFSHGLDIRFSPYLNSVVGSGGKSTLVRLLGYAFGAQGFLPTSLPKWLPDIVRVYWSYMGRELCIERCGKHASPGDALETWFERQDDGNWVAVDPDADEHLLELGCPVELWPSAGAQDTSRIRGDFETTTINRLKALLQDQNPRKPLLINQPRDIFNAEKLFDKVLGKPHLKMRQIVWATANSNVPVCMDAEKVLITEKYDRGSKMRLVCGGDLSEEQIRNAFLNCSEGGLQAFRRRQIIYGL